MISRARVVLVGVAAIIGLSFILPIGHALAAGQSISVTTSPVTLDLNIQPGTTNVQTLEFKNNGTIALPVSMHVEVFGAHGATGQAAISEAQPGDASTSWLSFSPSTFVANPNVWTSVTMTIRLPKGASLGYYYAVIFKPTLPTPTATNPAVSVKGSNAILVLVDTGSANEKRQVRVANFSATKHVYQYLPADFNVTLNNYGSIFLAPTGDIFISRNSDMTNTIATIPVNHAGANVLPQSNRVFQATWADGFPVYQPKQLDGQPVTDKKGLPEQQLVWNFSKANEFRFGRYYAQLALTYNDGTGNKLVISEVSFWVIPWWLLIGGLALFLLIAAGLWSIGRSLYRKFRPKHGKGK